MRNDRIRTVVSSHAPAAAGPYSQGIVAGDFLFVSGQLPINPGTGDFVEGDIANKTRQVMENIKSIVQEAGGDLKNTVKSTVYLTNSEHYPSVNMVYTEFFDGCLPARSVVVVSALPRNADIEMDAIVYIPKQ